MTLVAFFVLISRGEQFAYAQIKSDRTLGTEASVINSHAEGETIDRIEGGAIRGNNLFHSFAEFNVIDGQQVYFANPTGIKNIFSRVTGNNPTNILGTLGVLGEANLLILNPNGIFFGPNARIDLKGAFVASTADHLIFDGYAFSANNPQEVPLLTLNVPIGLQYGNSGAIKVQGSLLEVSQGQTLALVGGNLSLEGASLLAFGGEIELGSVLGNATVQIDSSDFRLHFPNELGNISLNNEARVSVRSENGGNIRINGHNLDILGGSVLLAGIESELGARESQAGTIEINTTGTITLTDGSLISNIVKQGSVGNSGEINITTRSLSITKGASVQASTSGQGNAGNINIIAQKSVILDGTDLTGYPSSIFNTVRQEAVGKGGTINITTEELSVTNGALLNVGTYGIGDAGNINIIAIEKVSFDGADLAGYSSAAISEVNINAIGNGGSIKITTGDLTMTDSAYLSVGTDGQGDAGSIIINARNTVSFDGVGSNNAPSLALSIVDDQGVGKGGNINIMAQSLFLTNGAVFVASTNGQGNAGNINIQAQNIVSLDGIGSNDIPSALLSQATPDATGDGGNINLTTDALSLTNGALFSVSTEGQGKGGSISIQSQTAYASNGASISVGSQGTGIGGNLQLSTNTLVLNNNASLKAQTNSSKGGNIILQVQDLLMLHHTSQISATAGLSGAGGDGGNININTGFLVAVPNENSDITANAFEGTGGRIEITTQGIFGIAFREYNTPLSDITASSEFGIQGEVIFNLPTIEPTEALAQLPVNTVDISQLIARTCPQDAGITANNQGEFWITGSGGLPSLPSQPFNGDAVWQDLRAIVPQPITSPSINREETLENQSIIEAQGWVITIDGQIMLIAQENRVTPDYSKAILRNCQITP
ncbi:filamentous hemagglutinin N-terminal domain-containing protein [Aphanothece hegewaldii]|uniref:two-partner secretion domain-containing protein n=1 Tax=Aphanothece hegewaldii TaxID=1521625 RepID=UPI0015E70D47|nr:filamentous hemagglutinin N-terminal domain-containing protein [Aphanothece hegewaldii]